MSLNEINNWYTKINAFLALFSNQLVLVSWRIFSRNKWRDNLACVLQSVAEAFMAIKWLTINDSHHLL